MAKVEKNKANGASYDKQSSKSGDKGRDGFGRY